MQRTSQRGLEGASVSRGAHPKNSAHSFARLNFPLGEHTRPRVWFSAPSLKTCIRKTNRAKSPSSHSWREGACAPQSIPELSEISAPCSARSASDLLLGSGARVRLRAVTRAGRLVKLDPGLDFSHGLRTLQDYRAWCGHRSRLRESPDRRPRFRQLPNQAQSSPCRSRRLAPAGIPSPQACLSNAHARS